MIKEDGGMPTFFLPTLNSNCINSLPNVKHVYDRVLLKDRSNLGNNLFYRVPEIKEDIKTLHCHSINLLPEYLPFSAQELRYFSYLNKANKNLPLDENNSQYVILTRENKNETIIELNSYNDSEKTNRIKNLFNNEEKQIYLNWKSDLSKNNNDKTFAGMRNPNPQIGRSSTTGTGTITPSRLNFTNNLVNMNNTNNFNTGSINNPFTTNKSVNNFGTSSVTNTLNNPMNTMNTMNTMNNGFSSGTNFNNNTSSNFINNISVLNNKPITPSNNYGMNNNQSRLNSGGSFNNTFPNNVNTVNPFSNTNTFNNNTLQSNNNNFFPNQNGNPFVSNNPLLNQNQYGFNTNTNTNTNNMFSKPITPSFLPTNNQNINNFNQNRQFPMNNQQTNNFFPNNQQQNGNNFNTNTYGTNNYGYNNNYMGNSYMNNGAIFQNPLQNLTFSPNKGLNNQETVDDLINAAKESFQMKIEPVSKTSLFDTVKNYPYDPIALTQDTRYRRDRGKSREIDSDKLPCFDFQKNKKHKINTFKPVQQKSLLNGNISQSMLNTQQQVRNFGRELNINSDHNNNYCNTQTYTDKYENSKHFYTQNHNSNFYDSLPPEFGKDDYKSPNTKNEQNESIASDNYVYQLDIEFVYLNRFNYSVKRTGNIMSTLSFKSRIINDLKKTNEFKHIDLQLNHFKVIIGNSMEFDETKVFDLSKIEWTAVNNDSINTPNTNNSNVPSRKINIKVFLNECILKHFPNNKSNSNPASGTNTSEKKNYSNNSNSNFVPIFLNKGNYKISPFYETLREMPYEQLKKVERLELENSFGKIEFKEPVDLTYVNLDSIHIEKGNFKISNDDKHSYNKLKKKALITLKNLDLGFEDFVKIDEYKTQMGDYFERMNCEYINYNNDKKELLMKWPKI